MNEDLKSSLRQLIRHYFESGRARDLVLSVGDQELRRIMKRYGTESAFRKDYRSMLKETQDEIQNAFIDSHIGGTAEIKQADRILNNVMETAMKGFKKIDRLILRGVVDGIQEGLNDNMDWQETARAALRKLQLREHHITTEITTTQAALDNTVRFTDFVASGVERLRYDGPAGTTRPWCIEHIDKVYTIDEVRTMVNDFGQPALSYCGGYNCRHRWVPIIGE